MVPEEEEEETRGRRGDERGLVRKRKKRVKNKTEREENMYKIGGREDGARDKEAKEV